MSNGGRVRRVGLPLLLASALLLLDLGFVWKLPCATSDWRNGRPYHMFCYTDIVPLYQLEGLRAGKVPYLEARNEYPVGTGLFMWITSLPVDSEGPFFAVNAFLLALLALAIAALLHRQTGSRAFYFTLAPALVLYSFLNWDLLPVALATAGTIAFLRGRDRSSGLLLGLGAAAKVFPGLLVLPFALERWRRGERDRAHLLAGWAAAAWVALNLPFAVVALGRWSYFFRFSSARPPTPGTLWYAACRALTGERVCAHVTLVNGLSVVAFVAISIVVWRLRVSRDPDFARWTFAFPLLVVFLLTNKVYSPQYSLWLLPWFALVLPDVRLFVAYELTDVAVFFTEFSYIGRIFGYGGLPFWPLEIAVVARAAVLVAILVSYVRGREPGTELRAQALVKMSPSASS